MRRSRRPRSATRQHSAPVLGPDPWAVEANVRRQDPEVRLAARKRHSAPIVEALKPWFEKQLSTVSSGSTLAGDIRYALGHWTGLTRFLEDGRLELDTNPVENAIRRSEEHTSELQSLMRISYAVFCLKQKKKQQHKQDNPVVRSQHTLISSNT